MTDENFKQQIKAELKSELTKEIAEQIEDEVEDEVEEEILKHNLSKRALGTFKTYFIAVAATIMALGQFSEAVTLIEVGIDWGLSKVTNRVEYDLISNIHVGNTERYITSILGDPKVSRAINEDIEANYYENDKFLLTVFLSEERVIGYTVIPLLSDFIPEVYSAGGQSWRLQEFNYASFPANPQLYLVDNSKTTSYYLEALDTGHAGLFFQTYLGNVALSDAEPDTLLIDLYNQDVNSVDDNEIFKVQELLRNELKPNLFGVGKLTLEQIQKSILTGAEFSNYFGR